MNILILGGTGLISTAITAQLIDRNDRVTVFNRGRTQTTRGSTRTIVGDRNAVPDLRAALSQGPYDAVIDMICFTPEQAASAVEVFAGEVPQYIFCSTVDVFTKAGAVYPIRESSERNPSPTFAYAHDKARSETIFQQAADGGAFGLTILRPGATYADGAVAPIGTYQLYVERLRAGLPIVIHGDGTSIWVAAHRDDVAAAFVNAVGNRAVFGRSYNLTGSELLTWNSYWRTVAQVLGVADPKIVHIPTDMLRVLAPEMSHWCVENFSYNNIFDNAAAADDLGYQYRTTWREGTEKFTFDFRGEVDMAVRTEFQAVLDAWLTGADAAAATIMAGHP